MDVENSMDDEKIVELKKKFDEIVANLEGQIVELKKKNAELMEQIEAMKAEKAQEKMAENPNSDMPIISHGMKRLPLEDEESRALDSKRIKLAANEIRVSNWVVESFAWIKRSEMADSHLSTSCRTFHELCWHKLDGNVKPHFVDELGFGCGADKFNNPITILGRYKKQNEEEEEEPPTIIPIAAVEPPEYILGFTRINLFYLDSQVIRFMEIASKSRETPFSLTLSNSMLRKHTWYAKDFVLMYNLLTTMSGKILGLKITGWNRHTDEDLCGFFNTFQEILIELQLFKKWKGSFIPKYIFDWLNKQRSDGKPKILRIHFDAPSNADHSSYLIPTCADSLSNFIKKLKQEFTESTKQQKPSFLIHIYAAENQQEEEFILESEQIAGQVLTLYRNKDNKNARIPSIFIAQYRKGEEDWKKE